MGEQAPLIDNNLIQGNISTGEGGALYVGQGPQPLIRNNVIVGNSAASGGALFVWDASPTLVNNTIVHNSAQAGGAISSTFYAAYVTVVNNVIAENTSDQGSGAAIYGLPYGVHTTVSHNMFWHNQSGDSYEDELVGVPTGDGNLFGADPSFLGVGLNPWQLHEGSTAIDAGTDWPGTPDRDRLGHARVGPVDIGAYEFVTPPGVEILTDAQQFELTAGSTFALPINVANASGPLSWSETTLPAGASFELDTRVLSWTPQANQLRHVRSPDRGH